MTQNRSEYDVVIIGGGPGGLSAAFWCAELGLKAILLEREAEVGGQLLWTFNAIKNYLGAEAVSGRELRDLFLRQVEQKNIVRRIGVKIAAAYLPENKVVLADGKVVSGKAVIVATGVRRKKLGVPSEAEFVGRGILESGAKAKNDVTGKRIVIVGGGDAALENALMLGETAERVFVIHRRREFTARKEFIERALVNENIEFVFNSQIAAIIGNERVEAVDVRDNTTSATLHIPVDAVLIRVGVEPNTELFHGQIAMDKSGYIRVDGNCSTDLMGIFAIGDVANPLSPTISTAVGQGATAAKTISDLIKA